MRMYSQILPLTCRAARFNFSHKRRGEYSFRRTSIRMNYRWLFIILAIIFLSGCHGKSWNNPYPSELDNANIYYASFSEQPKTLDPARAYSSDEILFIAQIYEPPLQYHYLRRPYTLVPLLATAMPQTTFLSNKFIVVSNQFAVDSNGDNAQNKIPANKISPNKISSTILPGIVSKTADNKTLVSSTSTDQIAYTVYTIHIKPHVFFQPHPAFARNPAGQYYYHNLTAAEVADKNTLSEFSHIGTRELTAEDFVYEIKRLADPRVQSPIYGVLNQYIVGFPEFNALLTREYHKAGDASSWLDLRRYPLAGVKVIDKYTYSITIKGYYPQFIYWLAMPFFAPIPWEAEVFYAQPGMAENNISLDWYPVGTGPYVLIENNPNRQMILARNPNFHGESYPNEGTNEDRATGLLTMAGKPLPFVDKFIFNLEKESIPRWNKFLQGYYDQSAISADSFDQAIHIDTQGKAEITPTLKVQHIRLQTSVAPSISYFGFNMLDPVVGGYSERAKKLRQALAIAVDEEEFIAIFLNGRGIPAQGPIPPGIFGYRDGVAGIDPYVYQWLNGRAERKSIATAQQLLVEAGYPQGRDPKTGASLLLNFDVAGGGSADDKALFAWLRKQFAKLGIQVQIRDTQYNRFQEKMRTGQVQLYTWGWNADYPDPENFLFLLYGPNGKVSYGGENASNYKNPTYDALFIKMRNLPNGAERQQVIDEMLAIVRKDTPWIWGFYPQGYTLSQSWVGMSKPNNMANNTLKYVSLTPRLRLQMREQWNHPVLWPLGLGLLILLLIISPVFYYYWHKQYKPRK